MYRKRPNNSKQTEKVDVFIFGSFLYELVTQQIPSKEKFPGMSKMWVPISKQECTVKCTVIQFLKPNHDLLACVRTGLIFYPLTIYTWRYSSSFMDLVKLMMSPTESMRPRCSPTRSSFYMKILVDTCACVDRCVDICIDYYRTQPFSFSCS